MPIALSVNVNKLALLRNSRQGDYPNLIDYAQSCIDAGANGITVHPRPDQRHIRPDDCLALREQLSDHQNRAIEFNIEGNPCAGPCPAPREDFGDYPGFVAIVEQARPEQVTLVPDAEQQLTSDHGFDLRGDQSRLREQIAHFKTLGCRVSLFMDPDLEQIELAAQLGADRIELYTGPFAAAHAQSPAQGEAVFTQHCAAAQRASDLGLGINAGHDLNLDNLPCYRELPQLLEVSIGHALTVDALYSGLQTTIARYLEALQASLNN